MALDQNIGMVTAYAYARSKGYTGTEDEFAEALANAGVTLNQIADAVDEFIDTTVPAKVAEVTAEGTRQIGLVSAEGTEQIGLVEAAGTAQIGLVQSEGTTQKNAVIAQGQATIASIPADYTSLSTQIDDLYTESSNIYDPNFEDKYLAINSSGKCVFYGLATNQYRGFVFGFTTEKSLGYKFTYTGNGISSVKMAGYSSEPKPTDNDFVALNQITGTKVDNDYRGLLPNASGAAFYAFSVTFTSGADYDDIFDSIKNSLYIFESDAANLISVDWDSVQYVPHKILYIPDESIPEALKTEIAGKVDKIAGKGLSQNDFTDAALQKLNDCYSEIFGESEIIVQYGDEGITSGSWASTTDGAIKTTVNTRIYDVTDFIPCSYGDMLYLCEVQSICFYDSSKAFLAGGGVTITNIDGYTGNGLQNNYTISNADAAYMRINFYNANYSSQMVNGMYAACRRTSAPYEIVNLGDSIFGLNPKPYDVSTHIQNAVMRKTANCGFGGTRAAVHTLSDYVNFSLFNLADAIATNDYSLQDGSDFSTLGSGYYYRYNLATLKSIDFSKVSVLTIAYGTNDWNAAIPLENISDLDDTSTFKGALRYAIEKIQTAYPSIMIVLLAPLYRTFSATNEDSNTKANSLGLSLLDYVDAIKAVANEFELPFIDNYRESGINKYNSTKYLRDETHLTFVDGAKRIGTETGEKMKPYF